MRLVDHEHGEKAVFISLAKRLDQLGEETADNGLGLLLDAVDVLLAELALVLRQNRVEALDDLFIHHLVRNRRDDLLGQVLPFLIVVLDVLVLWLIDRIIELAWRPHVVKDGFGVLSIQVDEVPVHLRLIFGQLVLC